MTPTDYDFLRQFLKQRSGLVLSNEKQYLIESRLMPVARKNNLADISDVVAAIKDPRQARLAETVVEAMTTNESFFYRDKMPFDHFTQEMIPQLMARRAGQNRIRIWCAAASTGQEPYTLAMCLKEMGSRLAGWKFEIIGTDISNEVLDRAKAGIYSQFEVQRGLPINLLVKYFSQKGEVWQISNDLRAMIDYRKLNLLESFAMLGTFDIIFCRNVLIYFDQATKSDVLSRVSRQLAPDGYLVLGAAETVIGLTEAFRPHADRRGLYVSAAAPVVPTQSARMSRISGR